MGNNRRLCKDRQNKSVCGVCAGLAKYLDADVNVVRIISVVLMLSLGTGLIFYIVAAFLLPFEDELED